MALPFPNLAEVFPVLKNRTAEHPPREKPSLKNLASRDLRKGAVWFSDDEHARYRDVNGAKLICILDRYDIAAVDRNSPKADMTRRAEGIQSDTLLLFVRTDEYKGMPRYGQEIRIDGVRYTILSAVDFDGVLEITIRGVFVR